MKITKIKADRLAVDLVHPYHLSKEYGIFFYGYTGGGNNVYRRGRSFAEHHEIGHVCFAVLARKNGLQKGWGKAII